MRMLTPIHDQYGLMVLMILALGSFGVSKHLHERWLKKSFSLIGSNAIVKTAIVLFGWHFFNMYAFFQYSFINVCVLGVCFGVASIIFEEKILRYFNRKNWQQSFVNSETLKRCLNTQRLTLSSHRKYYGLKNVRKQPTKFSADEIKNYSLLAVIIVAVMEEILFRGYLLALREGMHFYLNISCILFITLMFAFAHLNKNLYSVCSKLPLSILTTLSFIFTGNLLAPILTHSCLNIYAYVKKNKINHMPQNTLPLGMH